MTHRDRAWSRWTSGIHARWKACPRWARRCAAVAVLVLTLAVIAATALSPWLSSIARDDSVESLGRRFHSDVRLARLDVRLLPWPMAYGEELSIRPSDCPQGTPPLVRVKAFTVTAGYLGFFRTPVNVSHVQVDGAEITIPPTRALECRAAPRRTGAVPAPADCAEELAPGREGVPPSPGGADRGRDDDRVHATRIDARDVQLRLVPRTPGRSDRVFDIAHVVLRSVGRREPLDYEATLTNPIPRGDVAAAGSFGPWDADQAGHTPVSGRFTFDKADLGTIKGLRGTLDAHGDFTGVLERISVKGETRTPAFGLGISDQRLPLTTRFDATVDGTNGETLLHDVQAKLGDTSIASSGKVTDSQGGKGAKSSSTRGSRAAGSRMR